MIEAIPLWPTNSLKITNIYTRRKHVVQNTDNFTLQLEKTRRNTEVGKNSYQRPHFCPVRKIQTEGQWGSTEGQNHETEMKVFPTQSASFLLWSGLLSFVLFLFLLHLHICGQKSPVIIGTVAFKNTMKQFFRVTCCTDTTRIPRIFIKNYRHHSSNSHIPPCLLTNLPFMAPERAQKVILPLLHKSIKGPSPRLLTAPTPTHGLESNRLWTYLQSPWVVALSKND